MKNYDFKKAKRIITENAENLSEALLGMHEDWFWTATTVWKNGEYKHPLQDNADELDAKYIQARIKGMSMFQSGPKNKFGLAKINPQYSRLTKHLIGGIYGSDWATPVLKLEFKNGTERFINCYQGESEGVRPSLLLGCLSGPVQDSIAQISE